MVEYCTMKLAEQEGESSLPATPSEISSTLSGKQSWWT